MTAFTLSSDSARTARAASIELAREIDQRIVVGIDRRRPAIQQLRAHRRVLQFRAVDELGGNFLRAAFADERSYVGIVVPRYLAQLGQPPGDVGLLELRLDRRRRHDLAVAAPGNWRRSIPPAVRRPAWPLLRRNGSGDGACRAAATSRAGRRSSSA